MSASTGVGSTQREQLRIAVAMNGGVSLAVWMGGATLELHRLVKAEGLYADLLAKTEVAALVDVISGTSAGGLNGAFLGTALVHGTDLRPLRDMWIETGSFAKLLRDPRHEPSPASLLRGDDFFLPELRKVFALLARGELASPHDAPMDLTLTATQLVGRRERLADDFGTVIEDVDYRTRFRFSRGPGVDHDSFAHARVVDHLSLAARSSASFPGAFEASWIPMDDERQPGGKPGMRTVAGDTMMPPGGFVVDGGVLDNKPVEAAIKGIRHQRVGQRFRRVLLYVVPDPGESTVASQEASPTLASVVWSSLVSIPRNESVVTAFREARDENRRAEEAIVARLSLATTQTDASLERLALALFQTYKAVRRDRSVRYVVDQVSLGIAEMTGVGVAYGGQSERMRRALMDVALPWIPERTDDIWTATPDSWRWGMRPAAEGLLILSDALSWASRLDYGDHVPDFSTMWGRYFGVRDVGSGEPDWQAIGRGLATEGAAELNVSAVLLKWATEPTTLPALGVDAAEVGWESPVAGKATRTQRAAWLALETASTIASVAAAARGAQSVQDADIRSLLELLAPQHASDLDVMRRLLQFHVVASALGRGPEQTSQVIELMQVSAVTPDPFDPGTAVDVAAKLAGVQLGHFGAFYKRSWRANDWLRGRLDAAVRLIQLILSPAALRRAFPQSTAGGSAAAAEWVREIADAAPGRILAAHWERDATRISGELAFLDDPGVPEPDGLPLVVAAVARRLHADIAAEELPVVARAAERDAEEGSVSGSPSAEFLEAYRSVVGDGSPIRRRTLSQADALTLLPQCRIGAERVRDDDLGTDRFATTLTTTLAVGLAAAQAKSGGLGPLGAALRFARAPILIVHLLVRNAALRPLGQVITGVAATFGLTVVGLSLFIEGMQVVTPIGWALLVSSVLALWIRGRSTLLAIGGVAAVAALVIALREGGLDWGTLRDRVWPFLAVGAFFLAVGALPSTAARLPRRRIGSLDSELAERLSQEAAAYYAEKEPTITEPEAGKLRRQRRRLAKLLRTR
ncbi:MAG TPA: patatin-like protein [Actinomycetota bacterium]|jgi:predicted acylesterase/phospholipase RssA|nr:patatin-like protein [Actinomycetota bacterium]